jgi:hypothetical protein
LTQADDKKKLSEYRQHLVLAEQKAQDDYDKSIMSLSGGALGVSFAFIEKFVDRNHIVSVCMLQWSWIAWGLSLAAVIMSFWCSRRALRRAINEFDHNAPAQQTPGGIMSHLTEIFNILSGILFVAGVILMAIFASENLGITHG